MHAHVHCSSGNVEEGDGEKRRKEKETKKKARRTADSEQERVSSAGSAVVCFAGVSWLVALRIMCMCAQAYVCGANKDAPTNTRKQISSSVEETKG